jgi:multidrug efflux pump subunit AcrB
MIGTAVGSASRRPLGYAIVGGIFFSTALTLFVVPVAYTLLDRLRAREAQDLKALEPLEAK